MIRQIVIPKERTYTLEMPESFVGKKIELLAFEVEETVLERTDDKNEKSIKDLFDKFDGLTFESQGSYTFNRDEVTDYE